MTRKTNTLVNIYSDYKECALCEAKPGSPTLCESCLYNRSLVYELQKERGRLTKTNTGLKKRINNLDGNIRHAIEKLDKENLRTLLIRLLTEY